MLSPVEIIKNKQQQIIKARLQRYFKHHSEPRDNPLRDSPLKSETTLVENSPIMRQRFRDIAQKIRIIRIEKNK